MFTSSMLMKYNIMTETEHHTGEKIMNFSFQFYNKNTGEQIGIADIQASNFREAVLKARLGLEGKGWKLLSTTKS